MHASAAIAPAVGLYVPARHLRPEEEGGGGVRRVIVTMKAQVEIVSPFAAQRVGQGE